MTRFSLVRRCVAVVAFGLACTATVAPALGAQTFSTEDPVLQRIWRLGMDSSRVQWLALRLLDSIGPRLTGSPGMDRAQDWIVSTYRSWGIDGRRERYGTWRGWRRGASHIDLIAPRVRTLEGTMLGWSPGTGGRPVDVEPIILPRFADSTEFVRWLPNARGKFVLISGPQPTCRPSTDWEVNATEASAARMAAARDTVRFEWGGTNLRGTGYSAALGGGSIGQRLEEGGAAGVISYRFKDSRGAMEIFETNNTTAPTIALSCEDYGLVFRLTENRMGPRLRVSLDAELLGEVPVTNAIGTIRGSTKPNEYVVLSSHFDSWDGSSGATDNGTGTLTMLEAMRILKLVLPNPQRTIISGHWSAEEQGLVGSRAFAEDHPEILAGMQGLFNQDNGTGRIQRVSASGWPAAANALLRWHDRLPKELRDQAPFYGGGGASTLGVGGGGSDNASFACYGAPTFGLGAASWDYSNYTWHTDRDTYDKVVFDDLRANATLTAMLAYMAAQDAEFIKRDTSITVITRPVPEGAATAGGRGGRGGGRGDAAGGRGGGGRGDAAGAGRGGGRGNAGAGGRGGGRGAGDPANCPKAARTTNPRLR